VIVVDTNVIGYLFLASEQSEQAERALMKDSEWVAPLLWRSELRNVLATYLHEKLIALEDALHVIQEAEAMMQDGEYEMASAQVLRLATSSGCSAYDCEFVALADDLNAPLITVDKKILAQFPNIAVALYDFVTV